MKIYISFNTTLQLKSVIHKYLGKRYMTIHQY